MRVLCVPIFTGLLLLSPGVGHADCGERQFFPEGELFAPPVASPLQPRAELSAQILRFRDPRIAVAPPVHRLDLGMVQMGEEFGFFRWEREDCAAVQLGLHGLVFSAFDWGVPSTDLLFVDYEIGFPISLRWKAWSARFRLLHFSSHLGDELLLHNEPFDRVDLSYESVELLVARQWSTLRLYGGGSLFVSTSPPQPRWRAQAGAELRLRRWRWEVGEDFSLLPLVAADLQLWQSRDWEPSAKVVAGVEVKNGDSSRRLRILLDWLEGHLPYSQFSSTHEVRSFGALGQLEF